MLTNHSLSVRLSFISVDLPIWSTIETSATLYQKDQERFHLLLTEPNLRGDEPELSDSKDSQQENSENFRLLWLEISPYRVMLTMQRHGRLSYRHIWEQGIYGISRYWLQSDSLEGHQLLQLRNYTRSLQLTGRPFPQNLRLEYELWSEKVPLGRYVLNLEIDH
ncbi:hypothetical protein [Lyngbya aestuarii]|uniref:hypothetical protein n=1 Tax=Lyngbya aestuarii TaxID=118322 RepID=UPI00403E2272